MVIKGLWRQRLRARVTSVPVRASRFTLRVHLELSVRCVLLDISNDYSLAGYLTYPISP